MRAIAKLTDGGIAAPIEISEMRYDGSLVAQRPVGALLERRGLDHHVGQDIRIDPIDRGRDAPAGAPQRGPRAIGGRGVVQRLVGTVSGLLRLLDAFGGEIACLGGGLLGSRLGLFRRLLGPVEETHPNP